MSSTNSPSFNKEFEEENINFQEIIEKYLHHWKWFILGLFLTLGIAFAYLRYSMPVYESQASVLIKEDQKSGGIPGMDVLKDFDLKGGSENLQNEMEIYRSRTLLEGVAKKLKLNFSLQLLGDRSGLIRGVIYDNAPISFEIVGHDSLLYKERGIYEITILNNKKFELSTSEGSILGTYLFGAVLKLPSGQIIINKTSKLDKKWYGKSLLLTITPLDLVVTSLQNGVSVERSNKESMVLKIGYKGPNIEKNNDIINELIAQRKAGAINDKNEVASNTSTFINDRMKFISLELSDVEDVGQQYKTKHNLVDVTTDASQYLAKESATDQAITETTIQLSLAEFMNDYIKQHQGYADLFPSNLGIEDQSIATMTNQYNELVLDRNRLLQNSSERNPAVQKIEGQLASLKSSLTASLKNSSAVLQLQLKKLKSQESLYKTKISSIPQFEREYRDILRQQQIKETLYLYLLQKREENEITLAATVGNTKVVDYAYSDGIPVSPKRKIIYLGAFLMGLFIPFGILYIRDLMDNKVHTHKDLDKFNLPQVGNIPINLKGEKLVALENPRSVISEAFRILRTNISFLFTEPKEKGNTLFVTSTIAAEGKSFVSLNIAHSLSLVGKKVVVVGLDLRAPTLLQYMGMPLTIKGVTNYIVDPNMKLSDIIIPIKGTENLFMVPSGITPPNPSELLMKPRLQQLFDELKMEFDYVVVDTAPVALVTDTLTVSNLADVSLYVVRAETLDKRMLEVPTRLYREKKLINMTVVLNGVINKGKSYRYGYGYGYGYGAETSKKKSFFNKFKKKK